MEAKLAVMAFFLGPFHIAVRVATSSLLDQRSGFQPLFGVTEHRVIQQLRVSQCNCNQMAIK